MTIVLQVVALIGAVVGLGLSTMLAFKLASYLEAKRSEAEAADVLMRKVHDELSRAADEWWS